MKKIFSKFLMTVLVLTLVLSIAACSSTNVEITPVSPLDSYKVTITNGSGSGTYNEGSSVTIKATIEEDEVFDGWYDGDTLVSSEVEYTFTVSADVSYEAVVSAKYANLTITGGGYEQTSGLTSTTVEIGQEVTVVADDNYTTKAFDYFMIGDEKVTANPYVYTATADDVTISTIYKETKCYVFVDGGLLNGAEQTTVTYFEPGTEITISFEATLYDAGYFYSWYTENDGVQTQLSRDSSYTFEVNQSMYIYANLVTGYSLEVTSGTITSTDSYIVENGEVSSSAVQSSATLFEDASTTITYVAKDGETQGFRSWYMYNALGEIETLSYESSYTFVAKDDMQIFAEIGDATHYDVAVTGGAISGYEGSTLEMLNGREVTVTATEPTDSTMIFQGWKDGSTNIDGTDIVLTFDTSYTFTVTEDVDLVASYAKKIVVPETVSGSYTQTRGDSLSTITLTNGIWSWGENGTNAQYGELLTFPKLGTTNGALDIANVDGITMYFYAGADDARDRYVATATVTKVTSPYTTYTSTDDCKVYFNSSAALATYTPTSTNQYMFEFNGLYGEKAILFGLAWNNGTGGSTTIQAGTGRDIWLAMNDVISNYDDYGNYYAAMQLVGAEGYEDSDITSCARVAMTNLGTKSWDEVAYGDVSPEITTYDLTIDGSTVAVAEGTEYTLTLPTKEGYSYEWSVTSGGVTIVDNKFTMPANDVVITSIETKDTYTITDTTGTGGTIAFSSDTAQYGDTVTVTVTPDTDYELISLAVVDNDNIVLTQDETDSSKYTFTMPSGNISILAKFQVIGLTATVTVSGGTITDYEGSEASIGVGAEATVVATAGADGEIFQGWTDADGNFLTIEESYTFEVAEDVSLTASYSKNIAITEDYDWDETFRYGLSGTTWYLEFLRYYDQVSTYHGIFEEVDNLDYITMYIYTDPTDPSTYVGKFYVTCDTTRTGAIVTGDATKGQQISTCRFWADSDEIIYTNPDEIYLTDETDSVAWGVNFPTGSGVYVSQATGYAFLESVIAGYSSSTNYYFAMQLCTDSTEYSDSIIYPCSTIYLNESSPNTDNNKFEA